LEFIASLISSLAWPGAVVVLAFLFRAPLSALIGRIRSAKGYGVEVGFEKAAEEVRADAAAAVKPAEPEGTERAREEPLRPVEVYPGADPTYTVISSWREVEEAIRALAKRAQVVKPIDLNKYPAFFLAKLLADAGVVNGSYYKSVQGLSDLRNAVAHGLQRTTYDEAVAFAHAADDLVRATSVFDALYKGPGKGRFGQQPDGDDGLG
jgi:hypothetical protein